MTEIRAALFAEDRNFVDFLVPSAEVVAGRRGSRILWVACEHLAGCRAKLLKHKVGRISASVDVVIVGADAAGGRHASQGGGHRRKRADLRTLLGDDPRACVMVADPCIEAWLYCDPRGFSRGVSDALGTQFKKPPKWPVPRSEGEAKSQLGRLISDGLGGALIPRNGFDFSREIVEATLAEPPTYPSLRDSLKDLAQAMSKLD